MFVIDDELKKLPTKPGVYIMYDQADTIIYVGKAINLRNRVRSYFRERVGRGPWIDKMITQIVRFEYIVTDSELEALVLENNYIKEYNPKYNTLLKDGKTYPYIKVTVTDPFPRVLFAREVKKDKAKYFGPFSSAQAVKSTIELLNKLFMIRTCNRVLPRDCGKERACLNYHIKQCLAPCQGIDTAQTYQERVKKALDFLGGNYQPIIKDLQAHMEHASEELDFEEAIRYRDLLANVMQVSQKQKMSDSDQEDKDVIAIAKDEQDAVVQVFFVRYGKVIGREHYYMTHVADKDKSSILQDFIKQFYGGTPFVPRELIVPYELEEHELIEQWLTLQRGTRAFVRVPQKGTKEKLVELAHANANMVLERDKDKLKREELRTIGAAKELAQLLGVASVTRMEAFDISNINGFENVGSMVVYEKGKPKKSDYRKFRIKTVSGPDDYACMREVLTRRFRHGLEETKLLQEQNIDKNYGSFTRFPDVIMMDGGKGQVNIASEVLAELGVTIPVCGMVKDDNHRTRGLYFKNEELTLNNRSEAFKMITRLQDEAHRFAIEYHRSLRSKGQIKSVLDDIPGVGQTRRKALMRNFASITDIKEASVVQLSQISEIPEHIAQGIFDFFHKEESGQ
ncbi:MAG: excinuclease ABC subunit UvrC [Lachnospiraceae bacterium]